ncbi:MAG: sugar transferase [bacterium]
MIGENEFIEISFLKRLFDITASLVILIILFPFLLLFYLVLMVEIIFSKQARGPLFYCEKRITEGKEYLHCKIRTCKQVIYDRELIEKGHIQTATVESKRENFLKVGWWIKKTYLDEAPQLFNVLKGDLSLVGPRPKPVYEYKEYINRGAYTKKAIRGGLTGLYQSYKGGWGDKTDVDFDGDYIKFCKMHSNWQVVWCDIKILFRTLKVV